MDKYISITFLWILSFLFLGLAFLIKINQNEKHYKELYEPTFKYGFLILLFLITLSSLNFDFINNIEFLKRFIDFLKDRQFLLTVLTIFSGIFTFYFNKEKVEKEIDQEQTQEEKAEKKREKEFPEKFPEVNKIWGIRNIVKWMYKEGWCYVILLLLILTLFTAVKYPYFDISFTGEHSTKYMGHVDAARNMYEQNNPFFRQQKYRVCPVDRPTGIFNYFGGLPVLDWGLLTTFYIFPNNSLEFNTRLFMNFLGILALILSYIFLSKWLDKKTALLIVFLISINPIINFVFFVTVLDAWVIIFGLISLIYLTKYLKNNNFSDLFLCGLFFGIGNLTKVSLLLWLAPIIFIILVFNRNKKNIFLKDFSIILMISLLPFVAFHTSLRNLPSNSIKSIMFFVVWIFIFGLIYNKLKKYENLYENIIQKIITNKLKLIIISVLTLGVGFLYFYTFMPFSRVDRFLTDYHLIFNWNMYEYMLINQFKFYMTSNVFYIGLISFPLIFAFGSKKYRILLLSFLTGSSIYWILSSKSMFFHSYYPHIIMISFALIIGLIFNLVLKVLKMKYLTLILIFIFILFLFPSSYNANIERISIERPLENIDDVKLFMQEKMNKNDIYIDERNNYRFLTIMTGIPQTNTQSLNKLEIIEKINEMGFGDALNYYNVTYLVTTRPEPEYDKYINLFMNEELVYLTENVVHRRDLIQNRVNSIPLPIIEETRSETLVKKYDIISKFKLEKQIGRYKFYSFVN